MFHIDDHHSLLTSRDIGVGAGNVHVAGVLDRHQRSRDRHRMVEVGDVENFQPVAIDHEGIAELHGQAARVVQEWRADLGADARLQRIVRSTTTKPRSQRT